MRFSEPYLLDLRMKGITIITLILLGAANQLYAQRDAILSDDGDVVTVGKVPDALRMADFANHLGLIRAGTRVRAFESRRDPAIPATWVKVEILEGQYKGKTGWALSQTVHVQEAQPKRGPEPPTDARNKRSVDVVSPADPIVNSAEEGEQPPQKATHRVTTTTALFASPSIYGVGSEQVREGSWVQALAARDDAITSFRWVQIHVLSGDQTGKTAWVPSHALKEKPIRSVIIANQADEKSWTLAERLARHAKVDLVATQDLEVLVDSGVDLSTADEIVIFEHSYSPALPRAIFSGDTPRTLADKLRKGGVRRAAQVELFVCRGGAAIDGSPSFAAQFAKELQMPVRAYRHYVGVHSTRINLSLTESFSIEVEGYDYKTDPFTDQRTKYVVPMRRYEFRPSGGSRAIGGVAEVFRKKRSKLE